jgi:hypothetical protein
MNGRRCIWCPLPQVVLEQQKNLREVEHLTVAAGQVAHIEALKRNNDELRAMLHDLQRQLAEAKEGD